MMWAIKPFVSLLVIAAQASIAESTAQSDIPSMQPSDAPSSVPSDLPSFVPWVPSDDDETNAVSLVAPSDTPSMVPSAAPSDVPSKTPSTAPSDAPSSVPSDLPSGIPWSPPSDDDTSTLVLNAPSDMPSYLSSDIPSSEPSMMPSDEPSSIPSDIPSKVPLIPSSDDDAALSLDAPSDAPSTIPSDLPSVTPSSWPSHSPSDFPSSAPSSLPSKLTVPGTELDADRGVAQPSAVVVSFILFDATKDEEIGPLLDGDEIDIDWVGNRLTVEAVVRGVAESVIFDLNGNLHTENTLPYTLAANVENDYFVAQRLAVVGTHSLVATPYSGNDGMGIAGTPLEIGFTIVDRGSPPATGAGNAGGVFGVEGSADAQSDPTSSDIPSSAPSDVPSRLDSDVPSGLESDVPSDLPSDMPSTDLAMFEVIHKMSLPATSAEVMDDENIAIFESVCSEFLSSYLPATQLGEYGAVDVEVIGQSIVETPAARRRLQESTGQSLQVELLISGELDMKDGVTLDDDIMSRAVVATFDTYSSALQQDLSENTPFFPPPPDADPTAVVRGDISEERKVPMFAFLFGGIGGAILFGMLLFLFLRRKTIPDDDYIEDEDEHQHRTRGIFFHSAGYHRQSLDG